MSGGWAEFGAALSYTPEELWLMEAGRLDICFWWAEEMGKEREISKKQGGCKCFLAYKLVNGYFTVVCTHVHTRISRSHIFLQTTLEYKLPHAD